MKTINPNILEDYLFSSLSFSTFKFDKLSVLSYKYCKTKIPFMKSIYLKGIKDVMSMAYHEDCSNQKAKHLAFQNNTAIMNSNILISNNKKEIKLYEKIKKNKEVIVSKPFSISDMPLGSNKNIACIFVNTDEDLNRKEVIDIKNYFENCKVYNLSEMKKEGVIFDQIKMALLRDDSDIYFVCDNIYANYIVNSVYQVNKIGINL